MIVMLPTLASLCEEIVDRAAELGVQATRASVDRQLLPAECIVRLREALRAIGGAAEALDRAVNFAQRPPSG